MKVLEHGGGKTFASALFVFAGILLSVGRVMAQPDTLWTRRYDSGYSDYAYGVAVDKEGNIIVTGGFNNGSSYNCLTIKYSPSGDTIWTRRYDGGRDDKAWNIAVDDSGNIVVTGKSDNVSMFSYFTIKYNSSGDTLWTRRYDGGSATDVVVDDSGNIIVMGTFYNAAPFGGDYHMIKYSPSGDTIWTGSYLSEDSDFPRAGALDDSGNVIMVGWMNYDCGGPYDYWIMKYSPSLEDTLWLRCYEEGHTPRGVVVDDSQNIIVTGGGDQWPLTIKYTPSGDIIWSMESGGCAIAMDDSGSIILAGAIDNGSDCDCITIKYGYSSGIEEDENTKHKIQSAKLEIQPNPFVKFTTIKYQIPVKSKVSLKIYDVAGRCAKTLIGEEKNVGHYKVKWDGEGLPTGIYFAKFSIGDYKSTKKLILIR